VDGRVQFCEWWELGRGVFGGGGAAGRALRGGGLGELAPLMEYGIMGSGKGGRCAGGGGEVVVNSHGWGMGKL